MSWSIQLFNCKCSESVKVTKIKVSENGKQAVFLNPLKEKFVKVKVDGCMIINSTACDWVISKENVMSVLIELKGCDVEHALKQIEATFEYLQKNNLLTNKTSAMIICSKPSKYPSFTSKLQKAKSRLAKQYKAPLHIVTGNYEFQIDRVLSHTGPF